MTFATLVPSVLDRISGLRPEIWLSIGPGFAREDIKSLLLSQGRGFVGDAVQTLQELAFKIIASQESTPGITKDSLLNAFSRQEIFRLLLSEPRIMDKMPELTRIKRQKAFLQRLDSAFQSARISFAHEDEEQVYNERLDQTIGPSPLRNELRLLSQAYEAWMKASSWLDLPILIRNAIEVLREGWPSKLNKPSEIWVISTQNPESLEKDFWDLISHHVEVKQFRSLDGFFSPMRDALVNQPRTEWERWHTLDDAAESLADRIQNQIQGQPDHLKSSAVLMPDNPAVRRSLLRALKQRNIPLADPRDPTRLKWDESLKQALLPLEVVASQFERQKVISWLGSYFSPGIQSGLGASEISGQISGWIQEINTRGIRQNLRSYSGGLLSEVHLRLEALGRQLGGKRECKEIAEKHIQVLKEFLPGQIQALGSSGESSWLIPFLEGVWEGIREDLDRVGLGQRKAPLLVWMDRLKTRLQEVTPPVERLKSSEGVQIYRLQQAPVFPVQKVWVFGLPPQWLDVRGVGGYWLTDREREILSVEFAIRSHLQVREERIQVIKSWVFNSSLAGDGSVTFLDAEYANDGRERETLFPVLKELEASLKMPFPQIPTEMGSHPRFRASYQVLSKTQPQSVELPARKLPGNGNLEISATTLDRFSRCSFQSLGYHRWNLSDVREPDTELWPDVRGNILHEAVRLLMTSRNEEGAFCITPQLALENAWVKKRPKGLIRAPRVENYVKSRLKRVLEVFCEKEREYTQRSGTNPVSLDDFRLKLDYSRFSIVGQPDRVDEHRDGLFILDYKTSGTLPHGTEMIEQGYRLQLPFYALAIENKMRRPVLGVQYVELDRKGGRKSGIFFKTWNGKEKGSLTVARSNSKSLMSTDPTEIWKHLETHLLRDANDYIDGHFEARPRIPGKECSRCSLGDLCGLRRRLEESKGESKEESKGDSQGGQK